jgi:hypothetical protein
MVCLPDAERQAGTSDIARAWGRSTVPAPELRSRSAVIREANQRYATFFPAFCRNQFGLQRLCPFCRVFSSANLCRACGKFLRNGFWRSI